MAQFASPAHEQPTETGAVGDQRAKSDSGIRRPEELQRLVGNQASVDLLSQLQAKMTVGSVHDPLEREADEVAQHVVARLRATRTASDPDETLDATPITRKEQLHRRPRHTGAVVGREGGELDPDTEARIARREGGGGLPNPTRSAMEGAFGTDFSRVRIHRDLGSDDLNRRVGAIAFTVGSDIYLSRSAPRLDSTAGEELLAHELTHTIQQGAIPSRSPQRHSVRRFPVQALADPPAPPFSWFDETASVSRSSEGQSGGVFFLKTKNPDDPVQNAVIKPNFGVNANNQSETPEQLVFGDRAISELLGVSTPASRIVKKGTAEFDDLLKTCLPKDARPTDPDAAASWKPLTDAGAFIVMAAVPNASSLTSLAEKAQNDPDAYERFSEAMFTPSFVRDLGKLFIADSFIGNDDRMTKAKANLANIMVSSTKDGGHKLVAIDSRAELGEFKPENFVSYGSGSITGVSSTKTDFARSSAEIVDDFFSTLRDRLARGNTVPEGSLDPAMIFWDSYQVRREAMIESFEAGRLEAMESVRQLVETKEGRDKLKGVFEDVQGTTDGDQLKYRSLKTQGSYIGGRSKGKTHEEAGQSSGSYAALKWLADFNPDDVRVPEDDDFFWNTVRTTPSGEAYTASLDLIQNIPTIGELTSLANGPGRLTQSFFDAASAKLSDARDGLDQLGTKSRGLFSKTDQTRNRVVAGRYLLDVYRLGLGSIRARSRARLLATVAQYLELAISGKPTPGQAAAALPAANFLAEYLVRMQRNVSEYGIELNRAAGNVAKFRRYPARKDLTTLVGLLGEKSTADVALYLETNRTRNVNLYVNVLKSATRGR